MDIIERAIKNSDEKNRLLNGRFFSEGPLYLLKEKSDTYCEGLVRYYLRLWPCLVPLHNMNLASSKKTSSEKSDDSSNPDIILRLWTLDREGLIRMKNRVKDFAKLYTIYWASCDSILVTWISEK